METDFDKYLAEQMGKLDESVRDAKDEATPTGFDDNKTWYPDRGSDGKGRHLVRFLPQMPLEDKKVPFVPNFYHRIERGGRFFWELCPATIGLECDICIATKPYWKAPDGSPEKQIAYTFYRKKQYVANVFVIKDSVHPENTGKVKLWKFGVTVFNKLMSKLENDPELNIEGVNPFNLLTGADFIVEVATKDKRANYDNCSFMTPAPFLGGDGKKIQAVLGMVYDLDEFGEESRFKSGEVLLESLQKFMRDANEPDIFDKMLRAEQEAGDGGKVDAGDNSGLAAWLKEQDGGKAPDTPPETPSNTPPDSPPETETPAVQTAEIQTFGEEMKVEQEASVTETLPETSEENDPDAEFFKKLKDSKG